MAYLALWALSSAPGGGLYIYWLYLGSQLLEMCHCKHQAIGYEYTWKMSYCIP